MERCEIPRFARDDGVGGARDDAPNAHPERARLLRCRHGIIPATMVRLALLLMLVLVLSGLQCAASCAAVMVESPCHHHQPTPHHQDQAACSHELVLDRVHAPAIGHGFEACGAQTPLPKNPHPDGWGWSAFSSDLHAMSCHRQDAGSSISLRI